MSSLNTLINEYNQKSDKRIQSDNTRQILIELKEKFGNAYFISDDAKEVYKKYYTGPVRNFYAWMHSQIERKLLYKVSFATRDPMYRVVYIPDEGACKLTNDMKREILVEFNKIRQEAESNKQNVDQRRHEENTHLAYSMHTENKYLPIEDKPEFKSKHKETPAFQALEEVLLPSGMVEISTSKEANKRYDLRSEEKFSLSIKLTKGKSETFTFLVKDKTPIELLQKVINILEASK